MINLATSADSRYLPYTYVMLHSFLEAHPEAEIRCFLLHGGLSENDLTPLKELCEEAGGSFFPLAVDPAEFTDLGSAPEAKTWPPSAYYRLRLFDLLPEDVDRLLYLDGDIVIRGSLEEFYHTELGKNVIAACPDMVSFEEGRKNARLDTWPEMLAELLRENRYFNSGVLLMNAARLRTRSTFDDYRQLLEKHADQIRFPDQDLLNLVHREETLLMDPLIYNCMPYIAFRVLGKSYDELKGSAKVLHFAGPKPWEDGDHIHYPAELFWWEAAMKTRYGKSLRLAFLEGSLQCGKLKEDIRHLYKKNRELKESLAGLKAQLAGLKAQLAGLAGKT